MKLASPSKGMNPTRYSTVAKDLMQAIASGRYPVGSLLPTEFELCDLYNVSRHTVRAAIDQLLTQGLVSRRKRVGTRVEASSPRDGYSQSLASVADLAQLADTQQREIQNVRHFVADLSEAARLGLVPGEHYFCVSSLRVDRQHPAAPSGRDAGLQPAGPQRQASRCAGLDVERRVRRGARQRRGRPRRG